MDQKQRRGPQCSIEILGPIELQKNLKRIITQKNDQHTDLMNEPKVGITSITSTKAQPQPHNKLSILSRDNSLTNPTLPKQKE